MVIPSRNNKEWIGILTGERSYQFKFFAARILLIRLIRSIKEEPSPENVNACVDQLYAIFANNVDMPSVQEDLKTIFG